MSTARKLARDGWWRDVIDALERQGWVVEMRPGGHFRALPPDPAYGPVFFAATPSDRRARNHSLAELRRHGLMFGRRRR